MVKKEFLPDCIDVSLRIDCGIGDVSFTCLASPISSNRSMISLMVGLSFGFVRNIPTKIYRKKCTNFVTQS